MSSEPSSVQPSKSMKALTSLARTYSEYSRTDSNQQIQSFDDSIEEMLTRLDEYHGLLDMIRSDTSLCLQRTLPVIQTKSRELQAVFDKVDQLERFVSVIKSNVAGLEEQVEKADSEMGSFSAVKKVITSIPFPSFLRSKKSTSPSASPEKTTGTFQPVDIFKTSDYISQHRNEQLTGLHVNTPNDNIDQLSIGLVNDTPNTEDIKADQIFTKNDKLDNVTIKDESHSSSSEGTFKDKSHSISTENKDKSHTVSDEDIANKDESQVVSSTDSGLPSSSPSEVGASPQEPMDKHPTAS